MTFRVGQKVVCVDVSCRYDHLRAPWNVPVPLVKGRVYTVSGTENGGGHPGVYLCEVRSNWPPFPNGDERSFALYRFRPLIERKTDISVFKAMLTPASKKERV